MLMKNGNVVQKNRKYIKCIATSTAADRATAVYSMHEKLGEVSTSGSGNTRADRRADRQTVLIAIHRLTVT